MLKKGYVLAVGLLLLFSGCSQYVSDYSYVPRPALADVPPAPPATAPPVSAEASIIGVRYDDPKDQIPPSVEIRLRLDNNGPDKVTFDPTSLELSNAELIRFPTPIIRPPTPINLDPGQTAYVTAYFPFPTGYFYDNMDLNSLQLRWHVQIAGKWASQGAYFHRVYPYYYGPQWSYWGPPPPPPFGFYGGVVIVHRR
jgi:hypothetical protein